MNKVNLTITSLIILSVAGLALFFMSQKRLEDQELLLEEKVAEFSQQQEIIRQAQMEIQKDVEEKEKLIQQAREAQQMAEAQAEKERLERERLVAELNARLQRESENRYKAEQAQAELAKKMEALEAAQAEAQQALAALEETKEKVETIDEEAREEALALKQTIEQQNKELASLMEENKTLNERHQQLIKSQRQTAETIVGMGGTIEKNKFVDVFLESLEDLVKGAPHFWGYEESQKK